MGKDGEVRGGGHGREQGRGQGREQGVLLLFTHEVLLLNIPVLTEFCPNSVQLQYIRVLNVRVRLHICSTVYAAHL